MREFPKGLGPDVEVEEIELDTADVRYRGKKLTEARAERVAADILSRTPGRPSEVVREALDDYLSRHTG